MTTEGLFKILGQDRAPIHGGSGQWPEPGEWWDLEGPIEPCRHGLHLCRTRDLPAWVSGWAVVWRAEARGEVIAYDDKVVVASARLIEPIGVITSRVLVDWACACADRVAHLAEDAEQVCRTATRVARLYARGLASSRELAAARAAAYDAARDAAWDTAALAAAWDAARAAYEAARAAAYNAAYDAANAAASATAAWAAYDAASAAEQDWQGEELIRLIGGVK